jgi:hypothetical protein
LTPAQVREATVGIFFKQATKPLVLAGGVGLFWLAQAMLWALLYARYPKLHVMLFLIMAATCLFLYLGARRHYIDLALNNFQRFHGQPVKVRLEEDAYHYQASWGEGSIEWAQFQSLWCFKGVWVLLQHLPNGISVLLPAGALDEEARGFLRGKLLAVKAEVKD